MTRPPKLPIRRRLVDEPVHDEPEDDELITEAEKVDKEVLAEDIGYVSDEDIDFYLSDEDVDFNITDIEDEEDDSSDDEDDDSSGDEEDEASGDEEDGSSEDISADDISDDGLGCEVDTENEDDFEPAQSGYRSAKLWDKNCELKSIRLVVGDTFESAKWFRVVLLNYAAERNFSFTYTRNRKRDGIGAVCTENGCKWYIWCGVIKTLDCLGIRTFREKHTCQPSELCRRNITVKALAHRYSQYIKTHPKVEMSSFRDVIEDDLGMELKDGKLYRIVKHGREIHHEDEGLHYGMLKKYGELLVRANPDSIFKVVTDEFLPPRFKRLYLRYGAQKAGFLNGCRPLIGLDGCHMKSYHGGIVLSATARDAIDGMFPLVIAVVEQETIETWRWFMDEFFADFGSGEDKGWVFMSDKQKGLIEAFINNPYVEHRHCIRHLYENWFKLFKTIELKKLLWKCSQSISEEVFEETMEELKDTNQKAYAWLRERPPKNWVKAFFSDRAKCGAQTNNISETFNAWILKGRDKPILTFLEFYRLKLMKWFSTKSAVAHNEDVQVCPRIQEKVEKAIGQAKKCKAIVSGKGIYEVKDRLEGYQVNVVEERCSCLNWQLTGLPCKHGVAAMKHYRKEPWSTVHPCYSTATYKQIYDGQIFPIVGISKCKSKRYFDNLLPPIVRKQPGRPRKRRIKGCLENNTNSQKRPAKDVEGGKRNPRSRKGIVIHCGRCGKGGHNKRSCTTKDYGENNKGKANGKKSNTAPQTTNSSTIAPECANVPCASAGVDNVPSRAAGISCAVRGDGVDVRDVLQRKRASSLARKEKYKIRKRLKRAQLRADREAEEAQQADESEQGEQAEISSGDDDCLPGDDEPPQLVSSPPAPEMVNDQPATIGEEVTPPATIGGIRQVTEELERMTPAELARAEQKRKDALARISKRQQQIAADMKKQVDADMDKRVDNINQSQAGAGFSSQQSLMTRRGKDASSSQVNVRAAQGIQGVVSSSQP